MPDTHGHRQTTQLFLSSRGINFWQVLPEGRQREHARDAAITMKPASKDDLWTVVECQQAAAGFRFHHADLPCPQPTDEMAGVM